MVWLNQIIWSYIILYNSNVYAIRLVNNVGQWNANQTFDTPTASRYLGVQNCNFKSNLTLFEHDFDLLCTGVWPEDAHELYFGKMVVLLHNTLILGTTQCAPEIQLRNLNELGVAGVVDANGKHGGKGLNYHTMGYTVNEVNIPYLSGGEDFVEFVHSELANKDKVNAIEVIVECSDKNYYYEIINVFSAVWNPICGGFSFAIFCLGVRLLKDFWVTRDKPDNTWSIRCLIVSLETITAFLVSVLLILNIGTTYEHSILGDHLAGHQVKSISPTFFEGLHILSNILLTIHWRHIIISTIHLSPPINAMKDNRYLISICTIICILPDVLISIANLSFNQRLNDFYFMVHFIMKLLGLTFLAYFVTKFMKVSKNAAKNFDCSVDEGKVSSVESHTLGTASRQSEGQHQISITIHSAIQQLRFWLATLLCLEFSFLAVFMASMTLNVRGARIASVIFVILIIMASPCRMLAVKCRIKMEVEKSSLKKRVIEQESDSNWNNFITRI